MLNDANHMGVYDCLDVTDAVDRAQQDMPESMSRGNSLTTDTGDATHPCSPPSLRMNLHVGVLHYDPSFEPFPLLTDPVNYEPNTLDISGDKHMLEYWLNVLSDSIPTIMAKAVASEGGKPGTASLTLPHPPSLVLSPSCISAIKMRSLPVRGSKLLSDYIPGKGG